MTEQQFDEITIHDFEGRYVGLVEFGHGITPIVLASIGKSSSIAGTSLYVTDDGGRQYVYRQGPMDDSEASRLVRYWTALAYEADLRTQENILTIGEGLPRSSPKDESFLFNVYKYAVGTSAAHAYTIVANSTRGGQYRFQLRAERDAFDEPAADALATGKAVDAAAFLLGTANGNGKRDVVLPIVKDGWCVY
ncbi:hypothetical protein [Novilysobacter selenitireducens]|uniref:Uncharacterized protein n=1 Tax=Novilysobacter selenitireducens TaxID=2872639 RepID=A0ABS7T2I1_9GAMM|nr:hypothetical protein [Lysobacter selenitireducens]MBZ4038068.1 hypothetical protein [Lysobacter selenitireducens]